MSSVQLLESLELHLYEQTCVTGFKAVLKMKRFSLIFITFLPGDLTVQNIT